MPKDAVEFDEFGVLAYRRQVFRQFALLAQREKNVGFDTDDERPLQNQAPKCILQRATMLGNNCHEVYRDKRGGTPEDPSNKAARCVP